MNSSSHFGGRLFGLEFRLQPVWSAPAEAGTPNKGTAEMPEITIAVQ